MGNDTEHSRIGASSMYRWSKCPGSVRLSEGTESKSSSYAAEGTLAHEWAARLISVELSGNDGAAIEELRSFEAANSPFPFDMLEAVNVYVDHVMKIVELLPGNGWVKIEQRLDLSSLHPKAFGTGDVLIYEPDKKLLRVGDYKHGAGIPVEVEGNLQLRYYALGALLSTDSKVEEVEVFIVQPRRPHKDGAIRSEKFAAFDLLDFSADLKEAAEKTDDPNAPLVPGDHCHFCPVAGTCPALHERALTQAKETFSPVYSYDPKKLAAALTWLPTLEGYVKSVREFAYEEAKHGRTPPGFKLVEKEARRKWMDEAVAASELQNRLKVSHPSLIFDQTLKSPAQMEKSLGKDAKEVIEGLVVKQSSGLVLVPESDKRPPARPDIETVFAPVSQDLFS